MAAGGRSGTGPLMSYTCRFRPRLISDDKSNEGAHYGVDNAEERSHEHAHGHDDQGEITRLLRRRPRHFAQLAARLAGPLPDPLDSQRLPTATIGHNLAILGHFCSTRT